MSENQKPSIPSVFSGMSKKNKIITILTVIAAISLITVAFAATINESSIFGPPSGPATSQPKPTPTPIPTATPTPTPTPYSGTLSVVSWTDTTNPAGSNPATVTTGDVLSLTTTLTPTPTTPQSVWFYYSNTPITVGTKNIPTNPSQLNGIDIATSVGSAATVTFTVPADGTYYFIAEIPTPT